MSEERLERLETLIGGLTNTIDFLVTEFIRPATQQAFANYERLERLEAALDTLTAQTLVNSEQIASNIESIARLETKVDNLADTVADQSNQIKMVLDDQSNQIQILIQEGRADRQAQREALASIMNNANRINILEQRAS